jgi:ubiquinol-cytochrome c reductase cytochrome c subunit
MTGRLTRGPSNRVLGRVALVALLIGLAMVWADHSQSASASATASSRASASSSPSATPAAEGRRVFLRDCAYCHGSDGGGTQYGPTLKRDAGAAAADFYLRTGRMPLSSVNASVVPGPPAYDDATIKALVAYVASIGKGEAIPVLPPGDMVRGREVYLANCAACHGSSGTGMIVSGAQWAPQLYHTGSEQIAEAVRLGPGPMPEFTSDQIDDQDLADVVSYVQQLGPRQVIGGASLDQFGPIAEGAVALFVLVPAVVLVARVLGRKAPR